MRQPEELLDALRSLPCGALLVRVLDGDERVWVVGGAVRDLLLGREPRELDLVVEGGEAEEIARRIGDDLTVYDRFGTASVRRDGCSFDIARARAETYARPGALPDVCPATIEQDLRRRDVTVNAIALGLDGRLVALPGALDDLRDGVLRVLHDASFVDDPTRLWRVARYAARLGFSIDERTRRLASEADPSTVSGDRLGAELRLTLREPEPTRALAIAVELCPRLLPDGFDPDPPRLAEALELLGGEGRRDLVVLAACCSGIELRTLLRWLDELGFTADERDLVGVASRWSTGAPLRAAKTPSEIARAARGAPVEAIALAGGDAARRWLEQLRHVRLEIDGRDLLAAGIQEGPKIGEALRRTLELKLDGQLAGREQELAAALRVAGSRR